VKIFPCVLNYAQINALADNQCQIPTGITASEAAQLSIVQISEGEWQVDVIGDGTPHDLRLIDALGASVLHTRFSGSIVIDGRHLAAGAYTVVVSSSERSLVERVVR
jgi:hypothetical protein